jgi:hypothetical protein
MGDPSRLQLQTDAKAKSIHRHRLETKSNTNLRNKYMCSPQVQDGIIWTCIRASWRYGQLMLQTK